MKNNLWAVRKVLEEHLTSINDNTAEIHALFDYLQELDVKLDRLSQRLEQTQLTNQQGAQKPVVLPLDNTERKVFLVLYTEEVPLSYREIAEKANLTAALIPESISSLIRKGIPLQRSLFDTQFFLKLDPAFKERQAKENIVNLSLQSFMG